MNKRTAIGAGAVLAIAAAVGWFLSGPATPKDDPSEIAAAFLAELQTGDKARIDAAWDGTSAEYKSYKGKEEFRKFVLKTREFQLPAETFGRETLDAYGRRMESILFKTGGKTVRVDLAPNDGKWKVERIAFE